MRNRLESAGKPGEAAVTAAARKLLAVLNVMLAADTDCRHPMPTSPQLPAS